MQAIDPLIAVLKRNVFYRRQYLLALLAVFLNVAVIILLSWTIYFVLTHPTRASYFATDEVGRLLPMMPLSQPNMSTDKVRSWATQAIEKTYSYDYVNYHSQLQAAQKYFTEYGWDRYIHALTASNNLVALSQRRLITVAKVIGEPQLITEGLLGQAYAWKFSVPVLVTYWKPPYDDQSRFSNPLDVSIVIQRRSILQSYHGLGIVQIISSFTPAAVQTQEISDVPIENVLS